MFLKISAAIAFLIAAFLGVASLQPNEFSLSRSITIQATPEDVFPQVNDFHQWAWWSPWEKLDPNMKKEFTGPESGEGSSYSWVGNKKVGEGKMSITKSTPSSTILIIIEFLKPMKATNHIEFSFQPDDNGTKVTWSMSGKNNLITKAFHMFFSLEKMVGPDFENGLAQLKAVVESSKKMKTIK